MDYKRLFKSRAVRVKIMRLMSFVPDKPMLKLQYRIKTGRRLDLEHPRRYTEKLQWYKLYYRDPEMKRCVDKYEVRKYLEERGFGGLLNELIGVYDDPGQVDFEALPEQFVLKNTLGGGGGRRDYLPRQRAP